MKISWLGHASFIIESEGKRLITDPFDEELGYPVGKHRVDIATVSHDHWDHNAVRLLDGDPQIIKGEGHFDPPGFKIKGIGSFHDKSEGSERGSNTIFKISAEGLDIVHLGDLGHLLQQHHIDEIGNVDVLLIPVGGIFTIDAGEAREVIKQLNPQVVLPMHFKTPHLSFELAPVEEFTAGFDKIVKMPFLVVNGDNIKSLPQIIVLDYLS